MKNKKLVLIVSIISIFIIASLIFSNIFLNKKSTSGSIDIPSSITEPIKVEFKLSDYKNKAIIELNGDIGKGSVDIEILDTNENIIWNGDIEDSDLPKKCEIKEFGDKIYMIISNSNDSGKLTYTVKNK